MFSICFSFNARVIIGIDKSWARTQLTVMREAPDLFVLSEREESFYASFRAA